MKFSEHEDISIPLKGITVFVGPNNSGKSLVLRELEHAVSSSETPGGLKIVRDFDFLWPTEDDICNYAKRFDMYKEENTSPDNIVFARLSSNSNIEKTSITKNTLINVASKKSNKHWVSSSYVKWGLLRLDGRSRFNLTNDQEGGDLLKPARNIVAHIFQNDPARLKVRALVKDAFGLNFVVDPTKLGTLRIRLSTIEPPEDEQSLNETAREFHRNATHIKDASDGVQAYTGIITAVLSGEYHTILIDEPEAFLHPPLARKLGRDLAQISAERDGCLMASTHSADFLMGCIQATKDVKVIRLEYGDNKSKGRIVDSETLYKFFKNPLMRSANAISSLFYDGVIITESDNDRAFYSEIYHRMSEYFPNYPTILFINAQNKQTIKDIMGPLRQFGVPAAAIVDIDIIKDGGKTWSEWMEAAQIPQLSQPALSTQRASLNKAFDDGGLNMKNGGLGLLDKQSRKSAIMFIDTLNEFGIFPVKIGELESWLKNLNVPGKKTSWTISMLETLGSDPLDQGYVKPSEGDVWEFVGEIARWVKDPAREGIS